MIKDTANFYIPSTNNEYKTVKFSKVGKDPTMETDFVEIPNIVSTTSALNTETKDNMFYGDAGTSTRKVSNAPSVDVEFIYATESDAHSKILEFARGLKGDGITQVEAFTFDGYKLSFYANVILENFGPDGAADDDATCSVSFTYAGGTILYEKVETTEDIA